MCVYKIMCVWMAMAANGTKQWKIQKYRKVQKGKSERRRMWSETRRHTHTPKRNEHNGSGLADFYFYSHFIFFMLPLSLCFKKQKNGIFSLFSSNLMPFWLLVLSLFRLFKQIFISWPTHWASGHTLLSMSFRRGFFLLITFFLGWAHAHTHTHNWCFFSFYMRI